MATATVDSGAEPQRRTTGTVKKPRLAHTSPLQYATDYASTPGTLVSH